MCRFSHHFWSSTFYIIQKHFSLFLLLADIPPYNLSKSYNLCAPTFKSPADISCSKPEALKVTPPSQFQNLCFFSSPHPCIGAYAVAMLYVFSGVVSFIVKILFDVLSVAITLYCHFSLSHVTTPFFGLPPLQYNL